MDEHEVIIYCPVTGKKYDAQYSEIGHTMCPACGDIIHNIYENMNANDNKEEN